MPNISIKALKLPDSLVGGLDLTFSTLTCFSGCVISLVKNSLEKERNFGCEHSDYYKLFRYTELLRGIGVNS